MRWSGHWSIVLSLALSSACGGKGIHDRDASTHREGTGSGPTSTPPPASATGGGAGSSTAGTGSDPASWFAGGPSGDCQDDIDCDAGSCVELSPGGYRVCARGIREVTECAPANLSGDECCSSDDCADGLCVRNPGSYCDGRTATPENQCLSDECENSIDCDGLDHGVCFPAGAYGYAVATCVAGGCRSDADCSDEPNGRCVLVEDPCCNMPALACTYPSNACRFQADCASGACLSSDGRAQCSQIDWGCLD